MANPSSSRTDRKTIEKNRRNEMKALYSKLHSLVPQQRSMEAVSSLPNQLDEAAKYIKKLQINLEKMWEKKDSLILGVESSPRISSPEDSLMLLGSVENNPRRRRMMISSSSEEMAAVAKKGGINLLPVIEIHEIGGSALEVTLITGLDCHFMFNQAIRLLHEEGAEILNASLSVVDDKIFHTIHSKVVEATNVGYGAARISERLKKFVHDVIAS